MSRLLRLSLILCLLLTGFALASARGQTMIGDRVVLCSGQAIILVYGPDGTPSESPHYCPDMAQALLAALSLSTIDPAPVLIGSELRFALVPTASTGMTRIFPQARDPPWFRFL